jgi:hypothetical protein
MNQLAISKRKISLKIHNYQVIEPPVLIRKKISLKILDTQDIKRFDLIKRKIFLKSRDDLAISPVVSIKQKIVLKDKPLEFQEDVMDYIDLMNIHQSKMFNELKALADTDGWRVLGPYVTDGNHILMQCSQGHIRDKMSPSNFKRGKRCPICSRKKNALAPKMNIFERNIKAKAEFYDSAKNAGWVVLGEYINSRTPVAMQCPNHHIRNRMMPYNFKTGTRCGVCSSNDSSAAKTDFLDLVKREGWTTLGEYITTDTPIEMICPEGHIRTKLTPHEFKRGTHCSVCYGNDALTAENEFRDLAMKEGWSIMGEYINNYTPIKMICPFGHIRDKIRSIDFKTGTGCGICSGKDSFIAETEFRDLAENEGWAILGQYFNTDTPIEMICPNGHTRDKLTPHKFKQGHGCNVCSNCDTLTAENEFRDLAGKEGWEVLGKYINSNTPIKMTCPFGHIRDKISPSNFKTGSRCSVCYGNDSSTAETEFRDLAEKAGWVVLGKYVNTITSIEMICPFGHIRDKLTPSAFKSGVRCRLCSNFRSKGECLVNDVLMKLSNELDIKIKEEQIHTRILRLRFDFQVLYNGQCFYIEFDGEQHFGYHKYFHDDEDDFQKARQRDLVKNHVIRSSVDEYLIRLDYRWVSEKREEISLLNYLRLIITGNYPKTENNVYCDRLIYDWIDIEPSEETIKKYII